jgi:hypothetical protein
MRCVKCLAVVCFGFGWVVGVSAKPPELPIRPEVEFKVPLFPLGDEFAERQADKPQSAAKPEMPEREVLEVMPREIETLDVPPREAIVQPALATPQLRIEIIESSDARSAFPVRDPELPMQILDLLRPTRR